MGLAAIGAINLGVGAIEAVVTGYLVAYLARIRPDILGERTTVAPGGAPL
jgi:ABC-type Co2+ transport system permease subunit